MTNSRKIAERTLSVQPRWFKEREPGAKNKLSLRIYNFRWGTKLSFCVITPLIELLVAVPQVQLQIPAPREDDLVSYKYPLQVRCDSVPGVVYISFNEVTSKIQCTVLRLVVTSAHYT